MTQGELGSMRDRWPFHSAQFWCGPIAGVGVGLVLGAALVELEVLTSQRNAWASLLGDVLVGVGGLVNCALNPVAEATPNLRRHLTRAAGRFSVIQRFGFVFPSS